MKKFAIAMGLLMLAADGAALAQSGGSSSGAASKGSASSQAPIGPAYLETADATHMTVTDFVGQTHVYPPDDQ